MRSILAAALVLAGAAGCLTDPAAKGVDGGGDAATSDGASPDAPTPDAAVPDAAVLDATPADASPCALGIMGGTLDQVHYNIDDALELDFAAAPGSYTSPVFDLGQARLISTLAWDPLRPTAKEVPGAVQETGYRFGALDLTATRLLLHFNDRVATASHVSTSAGNHVARCTMGTTAPDMCPTPIPAVLHRGIHFEGPRRLAVADSALLEPTELTVAAWVRLGPDRGAAGFHDGNRGSILAKGRDFGPFAAYALEHNDTEDGARAGTIRCYMTITNGGTAVGQFVDTTGFTRTTSGEWFHVACTYGAGQMRVYIDGVLAGSDTFPGAVDYNQTDQELMIGSFGGTTQFFYGDLDEVLLIGRAMTQTEIEHLFRRGALDLRFQVRSCDDALCDTEPWVGPDATPGTAYSELCWSNAGLPSLSLHQADCDATGTVDHAGSRVFGPNRWFQYRADFVRRAAGTSPLLGAVAACP